MKLESPRRLLARPSFHIILGLVFLGAFIWPMFSFTSARDTWWFLTATWALCIVTLAFVSLGRDEADDESARASMEQR